MKFSKERGAATLEAVISFTTFLFFIVTIISILNFCRAQARMSMMVDGIAQEISQYSYLYSFTGLEAFDNQVSDRAVEGKSKINEMISAYETIESEIDNLVQSGNSLEEQLSSINYTEDGYDDLVQSLNAVEGIVQDAEASASDIMAATNDLNSQLDAIANDPKGFMKMMKFVLAEEALNQSKQILAKYMSQAMAKKYLGVDDIDIEKNLAALGIMPSIENGARFDGLHFDYSQIFHSSTPDDILITVVYEVELIQLLDLDLKGTFIQTAHTKAWLSGDLFSKSKIPIEAEKQSIWDAPPVIRGTKIIDSELKKQNSDGILNVTNTGIDGYDIVNQQMIKINTVDTFSKSYNTEAKLKYQIESLVNKTVKKGDGLETLYVVDPENVSTNIEIDNNHPNKSYKMIVVVPKNSDMEMLKRIRNEIENKNQNVELVISEGYGESPNEVKGE